MKLLLLIASIVLFIVVAILGFTDASLALVKLFAWMSIGLALFAGSFLPIP